LIAEEDSMVEQKSQMLECIVVSCFRLDVQKALNQELHRSSAQRADGSLIEDFRFTNSGMGNIPVEMLNLRRNFQGRSRTLGDVYFERVSLS
jgi:hypothetical protein